MTFDPDKVLAEATLKAAKLLGMEDIELASAIGIDDAHTLHDLRCGIVLVKNESETGKRCLLLIRAYKALSSLVCGNPAQMQLWLRGHNSALGAAPMEFISTEAGMTRVVSLLEGYLRFEGDIHDNAERRGR